MSNVKLYAMTVEQGNWVRNQLMERMADHPEVLDTAPSETVYAITEPVSPGAAIVTALFPDLDATVREALGRLVDAWPQAHKDDPKWSVQIYRDMITGEWYDFGSNDTRVQWEFSGAGFSDFLRPAAMIFAAVGRADRFPLTDPVAVVAAIETCIRRVQDE